MRKIDSLRVLSISGLWVLFLSLSPIAYAATSNSSLLSSASAMNQNSDVITLAEADSEAEADVIDEERPRSGTLVLPAAADDKKSEKKCMTVCQRWGQECMIDPRTGVRKCRRSCKEFGQECF